MMGEKFSFACACVYVFGLNLPAVPYMWLWQCLGKVGEVTNVDSDGDIRVKVSIFQKWTFNPACLQSLSEPRPFGNGTGEIVHNHHVQSSIWDSKLVFPSADLFFNYPDLCSYRILPHQRSMAFFSKSI